MRKNYAAALSAAQDAAAAFRNEPRILGALAQAHEAAGESNQAIETLNRWVDARARIGRSTGPPGGIVRASVRTIPKTIDLLRRAQKLAPDDLAITRDLVVATCLRENLTTR